MGAMWPGAIAAAAAGSSSSVLQQQQRTAAQGLALCPGCPRSGGAKAPHNVKSRGETLLLPQLATHHVVLDGPARAGPPAGRALQLGALPAAGRHDVRPPASQSSTWRRRGSSAAEY